jgi:hypothetical protein
MIFCPTSLFYTSVCIRIRGFGFETPKERLIGLDFIGWIEIDFDFVNNVHSNGASI